MTQDTLAEQNLMFHDVSRAHRNAINAALTSRGLQDVGQPKVLILLSSLKNGSANQRELADALHISPATMAASLKSLERKGYVSKRTDQNDGRCKLVSITQKGTDAVKRCNEAIQMVARQVYQGFTEEEVAQLNSFYHRILANLYAIGGNEDPEGFPPPPPPPKTLSKKEGNDL